ncbi:4'-phosphopantetheinyl transferase [Sphingomonas sp. PP-CE-3A-406]|uniref:4'-phosphopantetheinyl transferase family protein n=1 Tax=Sphingomonas sp. PP-CE-3A-406 TaxID=2135659 RepID=UPI000EF97A15|nr:4'-phosphopantetheinyl transferase superfamily protein [Sphingomonas sp. PP-CE-3A-406]RMB54778.1 4'-phosphopantetheinyl transferase [Sphingomonas sp. PP-CE-3A-406]
MTPIWHDGPLSDLAWDGQSPVAWSVAEIGPYAAGLQGDGRAIRHGLAAALIRKLAGDSADVRLTRSPAGAPIVSAPSGWYLSLSSRGAHALIGVARAPIAVDREVADDHPPLWDMLTPTEADALHRLPAPAQPQAWLRRWTIKEAHAKLIGEPRRIRPEAIETVVNNPTHATATFEGTSRCWSRSNTDAIETVAQWSQP